VASGCRNNYTGTIYAGLVFSYGDKQQVQQGRRKANVEIIP
jgi:hypothetical protein